MQPSSLWGAHYSSIPIYWDKQGRPFLPVTGRGWPLIGLMVPKWTSWTKVKTARTSQGHLWRNSGSCSPTLRPMACPLMTSITVALGKIVLSSKTAVLCPAHSFWPLILVGWSSALGSLLLQQPLAIGGQATTERWSPWTPGYQCEQSVVGMQTSQIWKWNQSTQVSWYTLPLLVCQLFKTNWAENLSLILINLQHAEPPIIPEIPMSLLLLVGLPVSSDFTVALLLYHMLLEVSYH